MGTITETHRDKLTVSGWIAPTEGRAKDRLQFRGERCRHTLPIPSFRAPQHGPFDQIRREIERSKRILQLEDDWDGQGSPRYSEEVWRRAIDCLLRYARYSLREGDSVIPTPRIDPGPEGSIDIHWKQQQFELLMNIPSDPNLPAGFYGDDYGHTKIKGKIKTDGINRGLLLWLVEHQ